MENHVTEEVVGCQGYIPPQFADDISRIPSQVAQSTENRAPKTEPASMMTTPSHLIEGVAGYHGYSPP